MQKSYKGLARIYDYLLSGVNYQEWAVIWKNYSNILDRTEAKIIDLACGTGNSTFPGR